MTYESWHEIDIVNIEGVEGGKVVFVDVYKKTFPTSSLGHSIDRCKKICKRLQFYFTY
jgi:hypothetical protein